MVNIFYAAENSFYVVENSIRVPEQLFGAVEIFFLVQENSFKEPEGFMVKLLTHKKFLKFFGNPGIKTPVYHYLYISYRTSY